MSDTEQVIAVFGKAKALIMEGGWIQGTFHNLDFTHHCAIGAMRVAANWYDTCAGERSWVVPFAEANDLTLCGIASWNDAPGRTEADVLEALDKAILYTKETHR